ncbi:MAG TPA: class I SAM-dependent methyltransferase [Patescibacteria group bacterium]|nr:class I SAM-dependent methyltransferase [Patescibacteria group bacterium]
MLVHTLRNHESTRKFIYQQGEARAKDTVNHFISYLKPKETLLDVGSGMGNIALLLRRKGYPVTALDVDNLSFTPKIKPIIYNGHTMPFKDRQFDTALILTTLHHIHDPEEVLQESVRVAKRVIIIEDIYSSRARKYATFFMDSLLNLEFKGHPHSNKTDAAWHKLFKQMELKVVGTKSMKSFLVMRHRMYILESNAS